VRKIRDKDYDNYRRAALAAVADQKSALIAGYIAGLGLFASILGCYLVLLLLMALMGTLLSLPTLHEVASRTTQVVGLTGGSFRVFQGLLSFAMLLALLGAFSANLHRDHKAVKIWNFRFGKDFIPYFLLVFFLIAAYIVSWLPQATITILTIGDNTGSVPLWGILIITILASIPITLLLYDGWWYWYKKVIPLWIKDEETLKKAEEKIIEIANN
jgi:hypothetical protein